VIVFFKPRVLALFTGRASIAVAIPGKDIDPIDRMRQNKVDWLFVCKDYDGESNRNKLNLSGNILNFYFQSRRSAILQFTDFDRNHGLSHTG
jgi:hypothetical protein